MEIIISYQSKVPIYEQIVLQIKKQILQGKLKEKDPLPPMRTFAKSLGVSVITTQKAYEQLQSEGFINSVVGKGTFVSVPEVNILKRQKHGEIEQQIKYVINLAFANGYNLEEVTKIFNDNCQLMKIELNKK